VIVVTFYHWQVWKYVSFYRIQWFCCCKYFVYCRMQIRGENIACFTYICVCYHTFERHCYNIFVITARTVQRDYYSDNSANIFILFLRWRFIFFNNIGTQWWQMRGDVFETLQDKNMVNTKAIINPSRCSGSFNANYSRNPFLKGQSTCVDCRYITVTYCRHLCTRYTVAYLVFQ